MKTLSCSLLGIILLTGLAHGQLRRCSSWNALSALEEPGAQPSLPDLIKDWYLMGVFGGLLRAELDKEELNKYYYIGDETSTSFMREALGQFCSDYKNTQIDILHALEVISMEMRGEPQKEIDEFLGKVRSAAAALADSKNP